MLRKLICQRICTSKMLGFLLCGLHVPPACAEVRPAITASCTAASLLTAPHPALSLSSLQWRRRRRRDNHTSGKMGSWDVCVCIW